MKTKDAFALRNFDADKFLTEQFQKCGLHEMTLERFRCVLGRAKDIKDILHILGIPVADIDGLQSARRKYFKLQTILDDFIRRIGRHQQRLRNFQSAVFLDSDTREIPTQRIKKIFSTYTVLLNNVLPYSYTLLEIIANIDAAQKKYYREKFSTRLRQARKAKGLKQTEIAAQIGLVYTAYGGYERGRSSPDVAHIGILSQILDTTPNWLFGFD